MYEKMAIPTNDSCCNEPRVKICEKASLIHDQVKFALTQAYSIKNTLIGMPNNEEAYADAPIGCLNDELDNINAKLSRLNGILEELSYKL